MAVALGVSPLRQRYPTCIYRSSSTTPRSALNLLWPEHVRFAENVEIEGHENVAESVATLLLASETKHNPTPASSGINDNSAPSTNVDESPLSLKDGLGPLPKGDYAYDRLELGESRFRLLRISSHSKEGPVHGVLDQYTFKNAPDYEALSYTWSDESEESKGGKKRHGKPLFIGKHFRQLAVTMNCDAALKQLRSMGKKYIWIDAICINQGDADEKRDQIALMHQIYSYAAGVLIYLGPRQKTRAVYALGQDTDGLMNSLSSDSYIQELRSFFSKPYFSRIWVIQEVVLAKSGTVICGSETVSWHHVNTKRSYVERTGKIVMPAWI